MPGNIWKRRGSLKNKKTPESERRVCQMNLLILGTEDGNLSNGNIVIE